MAECKDLTAFLVRAQLLNCSVIGLPTGRQNGRDAPHALRGVGHTSPSK